MQGTLPEYTLKIKAETIRMAMAAMAELPFKMVSGPLNELLTQCDEQEKQAAIDAARPGVPEEGDAKA